MKKIIKDVRINLVSSVHLTQINTLIDVKAVIATYANLEDVPQIDT